MVLDPAVGATKGWRRGRRTALAIVALVALAATPAGAELSQKGDLFVRFDGGITPRALPRETPAPISVRIEGAIKSPAGGKPPALRRIKIALNRAGHLNTVGLPLCHRGQIALATSSGALGACGPALVGSGGIVAKTALPGQAPSLVRGNVLLFNSIVGGRPAVLAHIYQSAPVPNTRIVVFSIRHTRGTFGTLITGQLPHSLNRNGYLQLIFLQLERRYVFHGRPRAYLSASCAAPAGFPGTVFPFARASMTFADGRTLTSILTRSCRVA
jgi:hypothetical protein